MVWCPDSGHIPRGFCGATGPPEKVQVILVCAEPGDPHSNENHGRTPQPDGYLNSAYSYAWDCFKTGKDFFHKNIRYILNLCWPDPSFEEQMRYALITDAVLCSARREGGRKCQERSDNRMWSAISTQTNRGSPECGGGCTGQEGTTSSPPSGRPTIYACFRCRTSRMQSQRSTRIMGKGLPRNTKLCWTKPTLLMVIRRLFLIPGNPVTETQRDLP